MNTRTRASITHWLYHGPVKGQGMASVGNCARKTGHRCMANYLIALPCAAAFNLFQQYPKPTVHIYFSRFLFQVFVGRHAYLYCLPVQVTTRGMRTVWLPTIYLKILANSLRPASGLWLDLFACFLFRVVITTAFRTVWFVGGMVAQSIEVLNLQSRVEGSTPVWARLHINHTCVPLSPISIICYCPKGGDASWLGRQRRACWTVVAACHLPLGLHWSHLRADCFLPPQYEFSLHLSSNAGTCIFSQQRTLFYI